ncbi:MAG: methionine--tRNA ligase subunit beta [Acidobacteriales bacterium]|nr:methionine--tRNA ligase subunit beta [Terriglobales bacterium]
MSKSRGNIVRTETILDAFGTLLPKAAEANSLVKGTASAVLQQTSEGAALAAEVRLSSSEEWKHEQDLFASDVLRYFLLREIPFGQDGSFSFDSLVQRYNSDLANGYGNLVSRTLNLIHQNFAGIVPEDLEAQNDPWSYFLTVVPLIAEQYKNGLLTLICANIMNLVSVTDSAITKNTPWKLAKSKHLEDQQKARHTLRGAFEAIRIITALLHPIMPYATAKVWAQLGLGDIELAARNGELKDLKWGGLKPGTKLGPLAPIFPRAPKELIQTMTDMEQNNAPKPAQPAGLPQVNNSVDKPAREHTEFREAPISSASATPALNPIAETTHPIADTAAAPDTPQIAIDDFVKIDLRVARIVLAERIPKADKLLRLEVDLGYEKRQILSGIAQWYTPEELIGRNIVVIANLAPRKMRGLESHGMLLAASHGEDGKPILATFGEEIALGSRLK